MKGMREGKFRVKLMYSTCLLDKNGTEIYEYDILKTVYWNDHREGAVCQGTVKWEEDDDTAGWIIEWTSGKPYSASDELSEFASSSEIVGNLLGEPGY